MIVNTGDRADGAEATGWKFSLHDASGFGVDGGVERSDHNAVLGFHLRLGAV